MQNVVYDKSQSCFQGWFSLHLFLSHSLSFQFRNIMAVTHQQCFSVFFDGTCCTFKSAIRSIKATPGISAAVNWTAEVGMCACLKEKKKLECCLNNECAATDPFHTHKYFFIKAPLRSLYTCDDNNNIKKNNCFATTINWIVALMHPFDMSALVPVTRGGASNEVQPIGVQQSSLFLLSV